MSRLAIYVWVVYTNQNYKKMIKKIRILVYYFEFIIIFSVARQAAFASEGNCFLFSL